MKATLQLSTPHITDASVSCNSYLPEYQAPTSLSDLAIIPSETFNSLIVQNAKSASLHTTANTDPPPNFPLKFPRSYIQVRPLPCLPPSPANALNVPILLDTVIDNQACNMGLRGSAIAFAQSITNLLKRLTGEVCRVFRDGTLLFQLHRGFQSINQGHLWIQTLRRELSLINEIVSVSKNFLIIIQNDPNHSDLQTSQCREDLYLMTLDAEASVLVISGILIRVGNEFPMVSSYVH